MKSKRTYLYICIIGFFSVLFIYNVAYAQECVTVCNFGDCNVAFHQDEDGWGIVGVCGNDVYHSVGSGDYEGTICGGVSPCSVIPQ